MASFPGEDYDMEEFTGGCTEQRFRTKADLQEGTAGCARIDTKFENTERTQVLRPRSLSIGVNQIGGRSPANMPDHGEWEGGPIRPVGAY